MTGYLFKIRLCDGFSLGMLPTSSSEEGFSNGSNFFLTGFALSSFTESVVGLDLSAGQYRSCICPS